MLKTDETDDLAKRIENGRKLAEQVANTIPEDELLELKAKGISAKTIKKMQKQRYYELTKSDRNKQRKIHNREMRKARKLRIGADAFSQEIREQRKISQKFKFEQKNSGVSIILDCEFEKLMIRKEMMSTASQIGICYTTNRSSLTPVNLAVVGFSGETKECLQIQRENYDRWETKNIEAPVIFTESSLQEFIESNECNKRFKEVKQKAKDESRSAKRARRIANKDSIVENNNEEKGINNECNSIENNALNITERQDKLNDNAQDIPTIISNNLKDIIYLTADTDEEIDIIEPGQTFVLGGIVDKNRYPNLCADKAKKLGMKLAKLPIGQHVQLNSRQILTINQVFEILIGRISGKPWTDVFEQVIPKRKVAVDPKEKTDTSKSTESTEITESA